MAEITHSCIRRQSQVAFIRLCVNPDLIKITLSQACRTLKIYTHSVCEYDTTMQVCILACTFYCILVHLHILFQFLTVFDPLCGVNETACWIISFW